MSRHSEVTVQVLTYFYERGPGARLVDSRVLGAVNVADQDMPDWLEDLGYEIVGSGRLTRVVRVLAGSKPDDGAIQPYGYWAALVRSSASVDYWGEADERTEILAAVWLRDQEGWPASYDALRTQHEERAFAELQAQRADMERWEREHAPGPTQDRPQP